MGENILIFLKKIIPRPIFLFFRPFYHWLLAFLSALFYGFPSFFRPASTEVSTGKQGFGGQARKLKIIGVTGTNGKTTVVHLLSHILRESGFRVASISSLEFRILDEAKKNDLKMTMPGRFFLQGFLRRCVKDDIEYVILEVTSEGIKQFRHKFIRFSSAVLTNVTPEHIESHGNFEKYLDAKISLFHALSKNSTAIINKDDPYWSKFFGATQAKKTLYGKEKIVWNGKDFKIRDLSIGDGITFLLDGAKFCSPLQGEFNFYNIIAAVSTAISENIRLEHIKKAVDSFQGVPGRLEFLQKEPFSVVVDYAHTPDSLKKVYSFLRESNSKFQIPNSKLTCVLGAAGGGRDKWKRPEFGKIAGKFCDEIILTDEDPYDENPAAILDDIEAGFSQNQNYKKVLDRREAIREALKSARGGDTVVITGKGAEPWVMGPNNTKIAWDDRAVVKEELTKIILNTTN